MELEEARLEDAILGESNEVRAGVEVPLEVCERKSGKGSFGVPGADVHGAEIALRYVNLGIRTLGGGARRASSPTVDAMLQLRQNGGDRRQTITVGVKFSVLARRQLSVMGVAPAKSAEVMDDVSYAIMKVGLKKKNVLRC